MQHFSFAYVLTVEINVWHIYLEGIWMSSNNLTSVDRECWIVVEFLSCKIMTFHYERQNVPNHRPRLFVQRLLRNNSKEASELCITDASWEVSAGLCIPVTKGQWWGKRSHVMTSSWQDNDLLQWHCLFRVIIFFSTAYSTKNTMCACVSYHRTPCDVRLISCIVILWTFNLAYPRFKTTRPI